MKRRLLPYIAAFATAAACAVPAAGTVPDNLVEGLRLSVMEEQVRAGTDVALNWEIVPNGLSKVSLVLGIVFPDGSVRYYEGRRAGFSELDDVAQARRIVKNFPFNTRMSGALKIEIPVDWPAGNYQFICFVCQGTTCADIVYSSLFEIIPAE